MVTLVLMLMTMVVLMIMTMTDRLIPSTYFSSLSL